MDEFYPHAFMGELVNTYNGRRLIGAALFLPLKMETQLPFKEYPKLRVDAEVAGVITEGAFMPFEGRHYIMLSKRLLKKAGVSLGDTVTMRFAIADQNKIYVPSLLHRVLDEDPELNDLWEAWPVGKRRGWCVRIAKAKAHETKMRRIEKLVGQLYGAD